MAERSFRVKLAGWWCARTPGDLAQLAFLSFAVGLVVPALKVGVDWPVGYEAAAMAAKDSLSLIYGFSKDDYVWACAIGTAANVLFIMSWVTWWWPRVLMGFCGVTVVLMVYLLLVLGDSGMLGGIQMGYVLWVGGPVLLGMAGWRKRGLVVHMRGCYGTGPE
ncbi:MAG: hypothetical protein ACYC26_17640 [Phycisphaerales bacterium]